MEHDAIHLTAIDPAPPADDTHHAQLAFCHLVSTGFTIGAPAPSGPPSGEAGK